MIQPKQNRLIRWFFDSYIKRAISKNFRSVNFNDIKVERNKAVLLLANHFSWWDGFILYYLNAKLLKKKFHIMVLEETMQKVKFFKYLGAFSIGKNSREVLDSLSYATKLLDDPKNLVVIFPQGKLYSNFIDEVVFEKGVFKILEKVQSRVQLLAAATFIENFDHKKPSVNIYLQNILPVKFESITELNDIYQQHYHAAHQQQTEIVL